MFINIHYVKEFVIIFHRRTIGADERADETAVTEKYKK